VEEVRNIMKEYSLFLGKSSSGMKRWNLFLKNNVKNKNLFVMERNRSPEQIERDKQIWSNGEISRVLKLNPSRTNNEANLIKGLSIRVRFQ